MLFEANVEQIRGLDSLQLVKLMRHLMLAECRLTNISLRSADVALQITVADGGEDGRVEWTDGTQLTDFFPSRYCIFQAKAQNLTETTVKNEILSKAKNRPDKLNDAVKGVVEKQGSYIVFCSHAFTGAKINKLKKSIQDTIKEHGHETDSIIVEIYDANKIASWVDTHPSVALWLASLQRGRSVHGFLSHESWRKSSDICNIPWVAGDDANRFTTQSRLFVPEEYREKPFHTYWNFEDAKEACLKYLSNDDAVLRIYGPSGFGKSRFAYELFNASNSVADEIDAASVIYADSEIVGDELFKLVQETTEAGAAIVFVVDECSDQDHNKLVKLIKRAGSRVRLVTINTETAIKKADETLTVAIEPAPDKMIGEIAKATAPDISDSDTRIIQEIAKGFPKMAILAAQSDGEGNATIGSAAQYIERIVWGERQKNNDAQKAIEILSLFDWVGIAGDAESDANYIAQHLARMDKDDFIEHVKSFISRGIVYKRGNYVQVIPVPLAANLGVNRLALLPDNKFAAFFNAAPRRLQLSLLKRIRWLDVAPESGVFVESILAQNCMGNYDALNTDFGAECLDRLVHVAPDTVMSVIQNVFGVLSIEELRGVVEGRRHLVWALEKLVFRHETFGQAARLLRRLAAETEDRISNNASGQFKQLYQIHLSGTEAKPSERLTILDEGLASANEQEVALCIEALATMLNTGHFSRSGGAEEIGSSKRLRDWQPKTYGEIHDYYRSAITRLLRIATSSNEFAETAKNHLGADIRGLLNTLPLDDVKHIISTISSHYGPWYYGIKGVNEWLYYDSHDAPDEVSLAIREYFGELMPSDPVEQLLIYTEGWGTDFHDPDVTYSREEESGNHDFYYASRKAAELAEIIVHDLNNLNKSLDLSLAVDANNTFPFSKRLAELSEEPIVLFNKAVKRVEAGNGELNIGFFNGFIAGTDSLDPNTARECIKIALQSDRLRKHAIKMIGSGELQPKDIELVVGLLREGDVEAWECVNLSYGQRMNHLPVDAILPLIQELKANGAIGLWTALEIISMVLYSQESIAKPYADALASILTSPELFDATRNNMDGHNFATAIKLLARNGYINKQLAHSLVQQVLSICKRRKDRLFHHFDNDARDILRALIEIHPREVWDNISSMLLSEDAILVYRLENLLKFERRNNFEQGLLYSLPSEMYLDWARQHPENRAHIVVNWLPIARKDENEALFWHTDIQGFVSEFGDNENVLHAIASRLTPSTWWGSRVPHLEPLIPLLKQWSNHEKAVVRAWVSKLEQSITKDIQAEKHRDEEREVHYG